MFPDDTKLNDTSPENLCALDAQGFFPAPGEDAEHFLANIRRIRDSYRDLEKRLSAGESLDEAVGFRIGQGIPIPPSDLEGAKEETLAKYGFSIDWVPAYYLSKGLGFLWGGCTVITDQELALFFIRKDFRNKEKWFLYTRRELLAHEICHVARGRFQSLEFEEHFAYMTSVSKFRQFMGNCFRADVDALIFLVPVLILLIAQFLIAFEFLFLPVAPFFLIAASGPAYLVVRNMLTRRKYRQAEEKLYRLGLRNPKAVLFRMTDAEIREVSSLETESVPVLLKEKTETELRWQIIKERFF